MYYTIKHQLYSNISSIHKETQKKPQTGELWPSMNSFTQHLLTQWPHTHVGHTGDIQQGHFLFWRTKAKQKYVVNLVTTLKS